jgi:glycosyltransferase involved in cell wall biosynthesis
MIKIVHIITRLDMGGSARETFQACYELSQKYETILIHGLSLESKMSNLEKKVVEGNIEKAKKRGVKFISFKTLVRRISPIKDLRAFFALIWIIFKEKPHIVHTHTSKAGLLGRLAAKIVRVPNIVHTPHGNIFYGHFGFLLSRFSIWIEKLFSRFTDRMIALTDGEMDDYIRFSVCAPEKLLKIHSGVNVKQFMQSNGNNVEKRRSLGLDQNANVVGFVGWLLPIKGPEYLLKAMDYVWQKYPETALVFVGKGDLNINLRMQALQMSTNGKVKFLGWREDIDDILPVFDMLVLPSLNEGMGRVLVEAMAAGKPVVASNVGGIPDLVRDGETGYLVPPADEKALADGIQKLLEDPGKAWEMGQHGKKHCQQFSLEAMIKKLDDLYSCLITN